MSLRIAVIADRDHLNVPDIFSGVHAILDGHAELIDCPISHETALPEGLDRAIVIGGDGTMISQLRRLAGTNIPLIGVNSGRLGFLTQFDLASLEENLESAIGPNPAISSPKLLAVEVSQPDQDVIGPLIAANDCVIHSGPPFSVIHIGLAVDEARGPIMAGDGLVISTPIGSTAHNLSAGGAIVQQTLDAFALTPLSAHTLSYRPIVLNADQTLKCTVYRANPGSTLVLDGQVQIPLKTNAEITVRRHTKRTSLVLNPTLHYWQTLREKLGWAHLPLDPRQRMS